uniref:Regulator of G protein signaling like 1 n=1 Tax=Cairina moschata TaxID=8855 RepID=A0A8C3BKY1_CAIMO
MKRKMVPSLQRGRALGFPTTLHPFQLSLSTQVFGQTPFYTSSMGQWDLWPELPSQLDASPPALLAWLAKHRLPHFCRSSLCLHLVLCQKLLGFVRSEEAEKLLNWRSADRWLLEKCISGSQGMWRFRASTQGTAGEELTNFWLSTERLLGLDESDAAQQDLYLALMNRLKATHLREGSSVLTLCGTLAGSSRKARNTGAIGTRREMLVKMQQRALYIIQSYWLPKFFIQCKMGIEEEKLCWPLLQEYRERVAQGSTQEPLGVSDDLFTMHITKSQDPSGPYSSKKAKEKVWALVKEGRDTQEAKTSFQAQPERQPGPAGSMKGSQPGKEALGPGPASAAFGGKGGATSPKRPRPKAELAIRLEDLCDKKVLSSLRSSTPLAKLPTPKRPAKTLRLLPWALSADSCAGRPFRDFLKCQGQTMETRLLDLWHDLEEFLPAVLDPSRENSFFLRHLIADKIRKTYLEESAVQQLPLEARTLQGLREHLASGEFTPWIFRAQKEICKVLRIFYEKFLADEDKTFLQFMSPQGDVPAPEVQGHPVRKEECFLLSERINESLKLSQALHGTRNLEGLSSEHWRAWATRHLQQGGSGQAETDLVSTAEADSQKVTSNEPAAEKAPLPADSPSKDNEIPPPKSPPPAAELENKKKRTASGRKNKSSAIKVTSAVVEKPTKRPRHFVKVLHNPAHLQYFRQFLEERNADEPLRFWMAVEKLVAEPNTKIKSALVSSIVRNYFHGDIPAEERLDCHSSVIKEIREAEVVTPFMLMTAQVFVQKAMEKRWFKEYQDLFPPSETPKSNLHLRYRMGNFTTDSLKCAWFTIHDIVKSICKFHREMNDDKCRMEFEGFLRKERENEEENLPPTTMRSSSTTSTLHSHTVSSGSLQDKDMALVKRQLFDNQLITVNFLVDDLRFYLEINKFSRLADSAEALAAHNMRSEKEVAFLKRKAAIISKLFLNSDIPPKLRVNISEDDRDLIWTLSSKGLLNRLLYHKAKVTLLPILIHFWKRFCNWKVMKSFRVSTVERETASLPSTKTCSEVSDIYNPSNHAVIMFTLLGGIRILLPHSQKKKELQKELLEEQRDSQNHHEKHLPLSKPVGLPAGQAQVEGQMSPHLIHAEQGRDVLQGS